MLRNLVITIALLGPLQAHAQSLDFSNLVSATLVSDATGVPPGGTARVGILFKLKPGWHLNWTNPGDAGFAPMVTWTTPDGVTMGDVQWPLPEKFEITGSTIYGYEGEVLLTAPITVDQAYLGDDLIVNADVHWLACRDACVPGSAKLNLELPVGESRARASKWQETFDASASSMPAKNDDVSFSASADQSEITIRITAERTPDFGRVEFYPYEADLIDHSAPQKLERNGTTTTLTVKRSRYAQSFPSRVRGIIMSASADKESEKQFAVEIDVPVDS